MASKNSHNKTVQEGFATRGIFYYALVLVFKVVCGSFGVALLTP